MGFAINFVGLHAREPRSAAIVMQISIKSASIAHEGEGFAMRPMESEILLTFLNRHTTSN
jgi:hypothetical protein